MNLLQFNKKLFPPMDHTIDFINGSLSGIGNCLSGYIFDTLKVRMQLQPNISMSQQLMRIIRNQGCLSLFNGIYYPLITVPIVNAIVFGSYQTYKKILNKDKLSFIDGIQNGAFAGFVNSFVVSPIQLIKCKMQNDNIKQYSSSKDCLHKTIQQSGLSGLFKGLMSTIYRQIPAYAAQFACYQQLKYLTLSNTNQSHLSLFQSMIIGGLAGINCWIFSYPQDIIKTHIQVQINIEYKQNKYLKDGGFIQCGKKIYQKNGWKGFWRGILPCLIRAFVANAVGITIYQKMQKVYQESQYCNKKIE